MVLLMMIDVADEPVPRTRFIALDSGWREKAALHERWALSPVCNLQQRITVTTQATNTYLQSQRHLVTAILATTCESPYWLSFEGPQNIAVLQSSECSKSVKS